MLHLVDLTRTLTTWWADVSDVPTLYPGQPADARDLPLWQELWITTWQSPPRRTAGPDQLDLVVTLHIFARSQTSPAALAAHLDLVRAALHHQRLPILDPDAPETPRGRLRLYEPESRDLTRPETPASPPQLRHHLLTTLGQATEYV